MCLQRAMTETSLLGACRCASALLMVPQASRFLQGATQLQVEERVRATPFRK